MGKLVNFASELLNRAKLGARLGVTYDGRRDLYQALGYQRTLKVQDYRERYRRNGIARRIISAFPQATWRNSPIVVEKGVHLEDSEFAQTFQRLADRVNLYHYLERVDKLSGVGSYGTLLIGLRAGGALPDPVRRNTNRSFEDILFLSPYTEESSTIAELETEATNPRFGLPLLYDLDLKGSFNSNLASLAKARIHHSRILHIAEDLTEDEVFGVPRLEPVWNYLDDLDKVLGSSAEAFWRVVDQGIQFDVDKDVTLSPDDEEDFSDEIEEYIHGLRRYIRTKGITANVLGSETPDPSSSVATIIGMISGSTGIPQRILMGSEQGQLASSQDDRNFNMRVRERQISFAEPRILRPFIDRMIEWRVLPSVEAYEVHWPDLSTLTDKEKADVAARFAQAARNFDQTEGLLSEDEIREEFFGLPRRED